MDNIEQAIENFGKLGFKTIIHVSNTLPRTREEVIKEWGNDPEKGTKSDYLVQMAMAGTEEVVNAYKHLPYENKTPFPSNIKTFRLDGHFYPVNGLYMFHTLNSPKVNYFRISYDGSSKMADETNPKLKRHLERAKEIRSFIGDKLQEASYELGVSEDVKVDVRNAHHMFVTPSFFVKGEDVFDIYNKLESSLKTLEILK